MYSAVRFREKIKWLNGRTVCCYKLGNNALPLRLSLSTPDRNFESFSEGNENTNDYFFTTKKLRVSTQQQVPSKIDVR